MMMDEEYDRGKLFEQIKIWPEIAMALLTVMVESALLELMRKFVTD